MATHSLPLPLEPLKNAEETGWKEADFDDVTYLCGKPFFDVVLSKSHVYPRCNFHVPVGMSRSLPRATIPAVLRYNRKNWDVSYRGDIKCPRFGVEWKEFVMDNDLEVGDACVFELVKCSSACIRFKVHILRGGLPAELKPIDKPGCSLDNPVVLDLD